MLVHESRREACAPNPMNPSMPAADADPAPGAASLVSGGDGASSVADTRPWRMRRPVLAGLALYGTLAAVLAAVAFFWLRERELGRQDGLLVLLDGLDQTGAIRLAPDRTISTIERDVLGQRPTDDVRRRGLLLVAAAHDAAGRYEVSDRTYELVRRDWPFGIPTGALVVPWANMLVTAGQPERARDLLAPRDAAAGYGTEAEVGVVRERIRAALEARKSASPPPGAK